MWASDSKIETVEHEREEEEEVRRDKAIALNCSFLSVPIKISADIDTNTLSRLHIQTGVVGQIAMTPLVMF